MAPEDIDNITVRYSMLHSLPASDLEDSLAWNICHTQVMQAEIVHAMSRLEEKQLIKLNQLIRQVNYKNEINNWLKFKKRR